MYVFEEILFCSIQWLFFTWLLVVGCLLSVFGYLFLGFGFWVLVAGCRLLAIWFRVLGFVFGFSIFNSFFSLLAY